MSFFAMLWDTLVRLVRGECEFCGEKAQGICQTCDSYVCKTCRVGANCPGCRWRSR